MKNQCSMRWEETPSVIPSASTASFSAPTTSRCGPISAAFQCESADLYIWNPSWCSATGTTYRAPAREERRPRGGIEFLRLEQREKILVAEILVRAVRLCVVLEHLRALDVHIARIPFVFKRRHAVNAPVDKKCRTSHSGTIPAAANSTAIPMCPYTAPARSPRRCGAAPPCSHTLYFPPLADDFYPHYSTRRAACKKRTRQFHAGLVVFFAVFMDAAPCVW